MLGLFKFYLYCKFYITPFSGVQWVVLIVMYMYYCSLVVVKENCLICIHFMKPVLKIEKIEVKKVTQIFKFGIFSWIFTNLKNVFITISIYISIYIYIHTQCNLWVRDLKSRISEIWIIFCVPFALVWISLDFLISEIFKTQTCQSHMCLGFRRYTTCINEKVLIKIYIT